MQGFEAAVDSVREVLERQSSRVPATLFDEAIETLIKRRYALNAMYRDSILNKRIEIAQMYAWKHAEVCDCISRLEYQAKSKAVADTTQNENPDG